MIKEKVQNINNRLNFMLWIYERSL